MLRPVAIVGYQPSVRSASCQQAPKFLAGVHQNVCPRITAPRIQRARDAYASHSYDVVAERAGHQNRVVFSSLNATKVFHAEQNLPLSVP